MNICYNTNPSGAVCDIYDILKDFESGITLPINGFAFVLKNFLKKMPFERSTNGTADLLKNGTS